MTSSVTSQQPADFGDGDARRGKAKPSLWAAGATLALLAIGAGRAQGPEGSASVASRKPVIRPHGWALWKLRLSRLRKHIVEDHLTSIAAGVTYFSLLSLFPAIAALVALYGLFADPAAVDDQIGMVAGLVPGGGLDIISEQANRVAAQGNGKLGLAFALGLALSLWSANASSKSLFEALNIVYDEDDKRGFFALNAVSLTFTAGGIVFGLLAVGALVLLPLAFEFVGFASLWETLARWVRWPVLAVVVALALALIYRFGAYRTNPRWRWITWGSGFATVAWLGVSALFSWYAANFGNYDKTYGSLGAAIGFMTWMWISANIVLVGAEIDAELDREEDEALIGP